MRVSLSVNTFSGSTIEKCNKAKKISKSSVHIDYSGDYDIKEFLMEVDRNFTISDMHVIVNDPYEELELLNNLKILPKVVFIQLENLNSIDCDFFSKENIFPAIQVKSELNQYNNLIKNSNRVLLMTTVPGVSGGIFDETTYDVVARVKEINPSIKIYVDGGVTSENFQKLRFLGVHTVIIGSYLAKTLNWKRNFSELFNRVDRSVTLGSLSQTVFELPATKSMNIFKIIEVMANFKSNYVLVLDDKNEISGIVTDGDIKRYIASNENQEGWFSQPIKLASTFFHANSNDTLEFLMDKLEIRPALGAIPLADDNGKFTTAISIQTII